MSRTVNILGDTPKEQWLNAIGICDMAIYANVDEARKHLVEGFSEDDDAVLECLKAIERVLANYTTEMRRLVEGVFE